MEKEPAAVLSMAVAVCTAPITVHRHIRRRRRSRNRRRQPRYSQISLISPSSIAATTAWAQLVSCGISCDFITAINFDHPSTLNILLPLFEAQRVKVNYGSPYCRGKERTARKCSITTIDILGLNLWYLKSAGRQHALCPIFGLVPTCIYVWVDLGLQGT